MARFTKEIVKAGVYHVSDEHGNRREETISEDRIRRWAAQHRMMRQKGLNIPAPTVHSQAANPSSFSQRKTGNVQVKMSTGQVDSFTNGGFWDEMWTEKRPHVDPVTGVTTMVETLMGHLETPDEYASKIGTIVKETSIFAPPVFKDGKGREWKDAIAHAALVVEPIEPGQANFQPAGGLALAMSHFARPLVMATPPSKPPAKKAKKPGDSFGQSTQDNDDISGGDDDDFGRNPDSLMDDIAVPASGASMADAVAELRKVGLEVGDDATPQNFLERIILAARQKSLTEGGGEDPSTNPLISEPEGGTKQPASIAMAVTAPTPEIQALQAQNALLMGLVHNQYQNTAKQRIAALVASGRVSQAHADAHLTPLVPSVKMALGADGNPQPNELDRLLAFAESMPAPAGRASAGQVQVPGTSMSIPAELAQALAMSHIMPPNAFSEANPNGSPLLDDKAAADLGDSLAAQGGFIQFAR